jgi:hypothetical protein
MVSGGHGRSGPAPDPNALHRKGAAIEKAWILPLEGRKGRTPVWPLSDQSMRENEMWTRLWKLPQAYAWERMCIHEHVAFYVRRLVIAEAPNSTAAEATIVRQFQDSLGLSAPGLRSLRWSIEATPPVARTPKQQTSARDRLTVVPSK